VARAHKDGRRDVLRGWARANRRALQVATFGLLCLVLVSSVLFTQIRNAQSNARHEARAKAAAERQRQELERKMREEWTPVLRADFASGATLDSRLQAFYYQDTWSPDKRVPASSRVSVVNNALQLLPGAEVPDIDAELGPPPRLRAVGDG